MNPRKEIKKPIIYILVAISVILVSIAISIVLMLNKNYFETGALEEQADEYSYIAENISSKILLADSLSSQNEIKC